LHDIRPSDIRTSDIDASLSQSKGGEGGEQGARGKEQGASFARRSLGEGWGARSKEQ